MEQKIKHRENETNGVFYMPSDKGVLAELSYFKKGQNIIVIDHTETKKGHEGQGLASKLLEKAVRFAQENQLKIDPLCPFAEVKFEQNEEYQKLRA